MVASFEAKSPVFHDAIISLCISHEKPDNKYGLINISIQVFCIYTILTVAKITKSFLINAPLKNTYYVVKAKTV